MLRSAAKNHADVTVVVDPADYGPVLEALRAGGASPAMRRELARKVFHHTSRYDGMIAGYLEQQGASGPVRFPSLLTLQFEKVQSLRYGENPHQQGAFYRDFGSSEPGVAKARQLHGKEMSYNNLLDANAALELVKEFRESVAGIVKHNKPFGASVGPTLRDAYVVARAAAPPSSLRGGLPVHARADLAPPQEITTPLVGGVAGP